MASKSILQGSHDLMDNSLKSLTSEQKEIQISDNLLESPEVYCYVCDNNVSGKDITSHLYFGRLSCTSCPAEIVSCDMMNLSENPLFMGLCHSGQDHSFQNWPHDLNKFLTYNIQKDLLIRRFCEDIHTVLTNEELKEEVEQYISKLDVLLPYPPWRSALHQIKYMHHETKFHPTVNLTEEKESSPGNTSYLDDNVNLKDLTSYSPLPKPPKFLRKSSRLRGPCIVNTPVDGRYLVVKYPSQSCPESCPECYTVICPSKFSLNITNFTISYVCEYCYLVIYFIPNPVEGFDSNIGFKNERIGLKNANPKSRKLIKKIIFHT
nr:uncharacterized protein LOC128684848 [Cherax quadricarinatus]